MGIFSKELEELDKNTVQYMIDEMQDIIDGQKEQLSQKEEQLSQKEEQLNRKEAQIKQGICVFILDNLEEGVSRERILSKLQRRFELSPEEAEAYFREAMGNDK